MCHPKDHWQWLFDLIQEGALFFEKTWGEKPINHINFFNNMKRSNKERRNKLGFSNGPDRSRIGTSWFGPYETHRPKWLPNLHNLISPGTLNPRAWKTGLQVCAFPFWENFDSKMQDLFNNYVMVWASKRYVNILNLEHDCLLIDSIWDFDFIFTIAGKNWTFSVWYMDLDHGDFMIWKQFS